MFEEEKTRTEAKLSDSSVVRDGGKVLDFRAGSERANEGICEFCQSKVRGAEGEFSVPAVPHSPKPGEEAEKSAAADDPGLV